VLSLRATPHFNHCVHVGSNDSGVMGTPRLEYASQMTMVEEYDVGRIVT